MENEKKIVLPKEVQEEMLKFFMKTSIPRKKRLQLLSNKNVDERIETNEKQQKDKS